MAANKQWWEEELSHLLDNGLSEYGIDYDQLSREEKIKFLRRLSRKVAWCYNKNEYKVDPLLEYVSKFINEILLNVTDNNVHTISYVRLYCRHQILNLQKRTQYKEYRYRYNNDVDIQTTIDYYRLDKDKFWHLLQFCKYYVDSLHEKATYKIPSIKEQLESFVDMANKMNYTSDDWIRAYPEHQGSLYLKIGDKKHTEIKDPRTIHLLSIIISNYLKRIDNVDRETKKQLEKVQEAYTDINGRIAYLISKGVTIPYKQLNGVGLKGEQKELYNLCKKRDKDTLVKKHGEKKKTALLAYYMDSYLKIIKSNQKKHNAQKTNLSTDNYLLIARLLVIIHYLPPKICDDKEYTALYSDKFKREYLGANRMNKAKAEKYLLDLNNIRRKKK